MLCYLLEMNGFKVRIRNAEYLVEPGLHPNFYTVSCGNKSAMLGKGDRGEWEYSLQTSDALEIPAQELGKEIEMYSE